MKISRVLFALIIAAAGFVGGYGYGRWFAKAPAGAAKAGRKILYYVDPMHPAYKSDKPGIAPDCGMRLEPVYEDGGAAPPPKTDRKVLYYVDPQDANHRSDKPGLNPETGNDLKPVYADEPPPGAFQVPAGSSTFYFVVRALSGEGTLWERQLSLLYAPTAYGAFIAPLAVANADGSKRMVRGSALTAADIAATRAASETASAERVQRELDAVKARLAKLEATVDKGRVGR